MSATTGVCTPSPAYTADGLPENHATRYSKMSLMFAVPDRLKSARQHGVLLFVGALHVVPEPANDLFVPAHPLGDVTMHAVPQQHAPFVEGGEPPPPITRNTKSPSTLP